MKTSTEGLMTLIGHEAIVLTRYKDSVGVWTLGVGHTAAAGEPNPVSFKGELTVAEVLEMLRRDIPEYEAGVNKAVKVPLKQHEFDALVSFHFNTGAIGRAAFIKKLNAGDRAGAIKGIMNYSKPPEIIDRRKAEQALFATGNYPAPFATIYPATSTGRILWGKGKRVDLRKVLGNGAAEPAKPVPVPPAPVEPIVPKPAPAPVPADRKDIIKTVQERLKVLGYNPGGVDGVMGPLTNGAILSFKNDHGITPTDEINDELLTALATAKPRVMVPERANASPTEVTKKVPEAAAHWWIKLIAIFTGAPAAVTGTAEALAPAKGYLEPLREIAADVPTYVWFGAIGLVALSIYIIAQRGQNKSVEAFREGDRR